MDDPQWPRASAWLSGDEGPTADAPLLAVIGAPLSQASISPSRAHTTPAAVRRALHRYSTLAARPGGVTIDLAGVHVIDVGDLPLADLDNDAAQEMVAAGVAEVRAPSLLHDPPGLVILLGGDNSITRPAMSAAIPELSRAGLLTLDAHHDVRGFHAGRTNGTPVRGLIEDGLPGDQVVQVGIGTFTNSPVYRRYCDDHGITVITAAEARAEGVGACVQRHLDTLAARCDELYVDLDIDVLDAAYAPGCPGARPGGLSPHDLLEVAFLAGGHRQVVALDIVEVDAEADRSGITVDVAAQSLLSAAAGLATRR